MAKLSCYLGTRNFKIFALALCFYVAEMKASEHHVSFAGMNARGLSEHAFTNRAAVGLGHLTTTVEVMEALFNQARTIHNAKVSGEATASDARHNKFIKDLEEQLQSSAAEIVRLQASLTDSAATAAAEITRLSSALSTEKGRTSDLTDALRKLKDESAQAASIAAANIEDGHNQLQELRAQLKSAQEDASEKLQALALKLSSAEKLAADATARNEALILERDEVKSQSAELRKALEAMLEELAVHKSKADRVPTLEAELLTANLQKEERAQAAEDALHRLTNAKQALSALQESGTTNAADFSEKLRTAETALVQEKAKADELREALEKLQRDFAIQKANADRVSDLEHQLADAKRQRDESEQSAADASRRLSEATTAEHETIQVLQRELRLLQEAGTTNAADFAEKLRAEQEAKSALEKSLEEASDNVQALETALKRQQEKQKHDQATETPTIMYSDGFAQTDVQQDSGDEITIKVQALLNSLDLLWGRYGTLNPVQLRTAPAGMDTRKWAEFLKAKTELNAIIGISPMVISRSVTPAKSLTPQRSATNAHRDPLPTTATTTLTSLDDDGEPDTLAATRSPDSLTSHPRTKPIASPFAAADGALLRNRRNIFGVPNTNNGAPPAHTAKSPVPKPAAKAAAKK